MNVREKLYMENPAKQYIKNVLRALGRVVLNSIKYTIIY